MPNYCFNELRIDSEDQDFLKEIAARFEEGRLLNFISPMPELLEGTRAPYFPPAEDEANAEKLMAEHNHRVSETGFDNWWDFRIASWGCKWDVGGQGENPPVLENGRLTLVFSSAWSPPDRAIEKLFDDARVAYGELLYWEPGNAFCGMLDSDGVDLELQIDSGDEDWLVENIPSSILECFGLIATYDEWAQLDDELSSCA